MAKGHPSEKGIVGPFGATAKAGLLDGQPGAGGPDKATPADHDLHKMVSTKTNPKIGNSIHIGPFGHVPQN